MMLAFQCGEWDWETLWSQMSSRTMEGWLTWFKRRPQGQYHQDNMLAFASSMVCASNGAEVEPGQFLWYEKSKPEEELSVDDAWSLVSSSIPVAKSLTPEEKPNA